MDLSEAKIILNENGYELLDEGKLGRAIGMGALALGTLFGNANAISDKDISNYEKQSEQVQDEQFLTEFIKNKSGDLIRKIEDPKYTKFEIIYKHGTAKSITKLRNGNQIISYFDNTDLLKNFNYCNINSLTRKHCRLKPQKVVFVDSNDNIDFIFKNVSEQNTYFIKNGKTEKINSDINLIGGRTYKDYYNYLKPYSINDKVSIGSFPIDIHFSK